MSRSIRSGAAGRARRGLAVVERAGASRGARRRTRACGAAPVARGRPLRRPSRRGARRRKAGCAPGGRRHRPAARVGGFPRSAGWADGSRPAAWNAGPQAEGRSGRGRVDAPSGARSRTLTIGAGLPPIIWKRRQYLDEFDDRLAEGGLSQRQKSAHQAMPLFGIWRRRLCVPATLSGVNRSTRKAGKSHSLRHRALQTHVLKKTAARRRPVQSSGWRRSNPCASVPRLAPHD